MGRYEINEFIHAIHPNELVVKRLLTDFLMKLGIQTIAQLAKVDVDTLINKITEISLEYHTLVEKYWAIFIKAARRTLWERKRAKDTSWATFFDEEFTEYLSDFYTIEFFPKKLSWKDCLPKEFKDFKKEFEKVITNKKEFIKNAYKEIDLIAEFVDLILTQILTREILDPAEVEQRKSQLDHLIKLFDDYDKFNLIQVRWEGKVTNFDSSWLDDVGGSLRDMIKFLEKMGLINIVPWTDLEILKHILTFWKYLAHRQLNP